jgi:fructosamine-3-kinase
MDESDDLQILVMEWIEEGPKTTTFWQNFGRQLAELHHHSNEQFGLSYDNYMGALSQKNNYHASWIQFFIECRLRPQLQLASNSDMLPSIHIDVFEKLFLRLSEIFPEEPASLLHGDLWSGNFLCDKNENVVLIDPAVYYGHRSMDLAMTTLFGGFDDAFYRSYNYHFAFPKNYKEQWEFCNLYPLLIHLNLFGSSYLSPIKSILKRFE